MFEERDVVRLKMPRELRWIGPLFLILFLVLWLRRGLFPFFFILILFPIIAMVAVPQVILLVAAVVVFLYTSERHRFSLLILILSFFCSGILMEPIPFPLPSSPYPVMPGERFTIFMTPLLSPFILLFQILRTGNFFLLFLLTLLIVLAALSAFVIHRVSQGGLSAGAASLALVLILLAWTFMILPLSFEINHYYLTPVPFGPLIALNILPWVPVYEKAL